MIHLRVAFLKDPGTCKQKSLPHGKDLQDGKLQKDLDTVVEVYVKNADELAPLGSSQANESLNNSVGSKAPKIGHYGASKSNDYRVACAVSKRTLGISMMQRYVLNKYIYSIFIPFGGIF